MELNSALENTSSQRPIGPGRMTPAISNHPGAEGVALG